MCAGGWTDVEAGVVCRMMGHTGGHSLPGLGHSLTSPPRLAEVSCRGWETNILQCDHLEVSDQCPSGQGDASSDSDAAWSATKRIGFLEVARVGIIKKL